MAKEKKPFYKKWWFYLLAVIVIVVLANSGGEDKPATQSQSNGTSAPAEQAKVAKLNEEAAIGKLAYVASDVKKATTIGKQFMEKTTENQYVIIKVKVTNNGDKSQTLDTSMFKLKDSSGKTFTASGEADAYINDDLSFFLQQVNPGTSKSGSIAFETPKDTKGLKLDVTGGMFSSKTATIDLGQ